VGKIAKITIQRSAFLLIYCAILSKYTPTDCFFGAFAHWITFKQCRFNLLYQMDNRIVFVSF